MPDKRNEELGNSQHFEQNPPAINLPKGGGAIKGIGEKFGANPITGTGSLTVPIPASPSRSGFGPQMTLAYDSGAGNGPFGFGWQLSLPAITRKTDKGLPRYEDNNESDVFILSGAEDLVPVLVQNVQGQWVRKRLDQPSHAPGYQIDFYRPRIEGLFARIECWTNIQTGEKHWRSITRNNVTTIYGRTPNSQIADPNVPTHVFSWLICQSYDDKGNAILYEYKNENSEDVNPGQVHEKNRTDMGRSANRYLKYIKYGNRVPNRNGNWQATNPVDLPKETWMFELAFDYGEGHYSEDVPDADQQVFAQAQINHPTGSAWPVRQDAFSSYRAGFEVRTYRLCRRVLMFHHFPNELGIADYLVRSTEFTYEDGPVATFINSVTQSGFQYLPSQNQAFPYLKKSLPPVEFEYSKVPTSEQLAQQPIRAVDAESLVNLPVGLDGSVYQWMDLDGEGTNGVLTEQGDGWYYKRNISANNSVQEGGQERTIARLDSIELVTKMPNDSLRANAQFLDLAGDGQVDLAQMNGTVRGFYERTKDVNWKTFQSFTSWPDVNIHDPDLRFVDLTGDGHADILITEGKTLTWYPSLAEAGFGPAVRVNLPMDDEKGPRLIFADSEQSVYLADLSGDGLSDLVRIRNGEVCYWPNLGYGHFGKKVTMDHALHFDSQDQFDQRRIRLVDTDGSGTTDIIYLHRNGVRIYLNQSGNSWSDAVLLPQFPPIDNISSVQAFDLLGNGTACLVWSSPLPGAVRRPMRYIALMDEKPHLLIGTKNNLGAETRVHYSPSTKFYLDDKQAGKPWITRLPFIVHVVDRVEVYDHISRNRFVTRYVYHHGYFDGEEREFRGFGMVEQVDTEEFASLRESNTFPTGNNIDAASHVPPVLTKTWFHTGAFIDRDHISNYFAGLLDANDQGEYYREPGLDDVQARALLLPDTVLPEGLTAEEEREACRSLKGAMLRQEVYALDGTDKAQHPYSVAEQNFTIERLQPKQDKCFAVFFTHAREAISYHYERNPSDPRVQHALTLEVDEFGNVLKALAIGYGRRQPDTSLEDLDWQKQTQILITYTENDVTNAIDGDDYRTPLPAEAWTYELTGFKPANGEIRFSFDEWAQNNFARLGSAVEIPYEQKSDSNNPQKRLIERVRTLYRKDDLNMLLPVGELESLALPGESYKLAFTPGLLTQVYQRDSEDLLPNPSVILLAGSPTNNVSDRGGYIDLDGDGHWWIPSGHVFFSPSTADLAAQELSFARGHFFLPHRYRDPFNTEAIVRLDDHNLLMQETQDVLGNKILAESDYRVLQPALITDPNGNRAEATFDVLGMVVGTTVMGKVTENLGDNLNGFESNLIQQQIDDFHDSNDPHALVPALLKEASTRIIYDLHRFYRSQQDNPDDPTNWEPPYAATMTRETHAADPLPPQGLKIQISFSYSDGFGREIQKKIQAEPGEVDVEDAEGNVTVVDTTPDTRWVGSGWTIYNNKGKPVRQYEPFFSAHHHFQFGKKVGVSPVLFYDPVERVVATLHPNHTWEKVVFSAWQQVMYDVNDTVTIEPQNDLDVKDFFTRLPDADYLPTWYQQRIGLPANDPERIVADKASPHANTPTTAYFDSLGRPFLTVDHNKVVCLNHDLDGVEDKFRTRVELDIEGNQREVYDERRLPDANGLPLGPLEQRFVMRYDYDMLGNRIHQASMESGERWMLNDVTGKPIRAWDGRGHEFQTAYDQLRRPVDSYLLNDGSSEKIKIGRTVYGESAPNPEVNNVRGKLIELFDQAGVVTSDQYDFKGNVLQSQRQLAQEYKDTLDWDASVDLESETFTSRTRYDALNRPTQMIAPHSDQLGAKVNVIQPAYNEANLLEQVNAWLDQSAEPDVLLNK